MKAEKKHISPNKALLNCGLPITKGEAHESTNAEELEEVSETIRMRLLQKLTATLSSCPRYFSFHAYKMCCPDCNILLCKKFSFCPYPSDSWIHVSTHTRAYTHTYRVKMLAQSSGERQLQQPTAGSAAHPAHKRSNTKPQLANSDISVSAPHFRCIAYEPHM